METSAAAAGAEHTYARGGALATVSHDVEPLGEIQSVLSLQQQPNPVMLLNNYAQATGLQQHYSVTRVLPEAAAQQPGDALWRVAVYLKGPKLPRGSQETWATARRKRHAKEAAALAQLSHLKRDYAGGQDTLPGMQKRRKDAEAALRVTTAAASAGAASPAGATSVECDRSGRPLGCGPLPRTGSAVAQAWRRQQQQQGAAAGGGGGQGGVLSYAASGTAPYTCPQVAVPQLQVTAWFAVDGCRNPKLLLHELEDVASHHGAMLWIHHQVIPAFPGQQ